MEGGTVIMCCFEAIIGIGKSSAIERLRETGILDETIRDAITKIAPEKSTEHWKVCYVLEPSSEWRRHGWLSKFYASPDKRALSFQLLVFTTFVDAVLDVITPLEGQNIVCITERSMFGQLLFWQTQPTSLDSMENDAYMKVWTKWTRFLPPVSLIFHLRTRDIDQAMKRIADRSREEECGGGVTRVYQESLEKMHLEWFTEPYASGPPKGIPCVQIFTDSPYHTDDIALRNLAEKMAQEIAPILLVQ